MYVFSNEGRIVVEAVQRAGGVAPLVATLSTEAQVQLAVMGRDLPLGRRKSAHPESLSANELRHEVEAVIAYLNFFYTLEKILAET